MANQHGTITIQVDGFVNTWITAEAQFSANHYNGILPRNGFVKVPATQRHSLACTAPHAVNHTRNNAQKYADRGTGGLAVALATHLQCYGLAVGGVKMTATRTGTNVTSSVKKSHYSNPAQPTFLTYTAWEMQARVWIAKSD